jgi:hypothetical protein
LLKIDKDSIGKIPNDILGFDKTDTQNKLIMQAFLSEQMERIIDYYPSNTLFPIETYLEYYCIPIRDSQQEEVVSLAVISVNITDKMQFSESRERLNSIVGVSQDAIFVVDVNQRVLS